MSIEKFMEAICAPYVILFSLGWLTRMDIAKGFYPSWLKIFKACLSPSMDTSNLTRWFLPINRTLTFRDLLQIYSRCDTLPSCKARETRLSPLPSAGIKTNPAISSHKESWIVPRSLRQVWTIVIAARITCTLRRYRSGEVCWSQCIACLNSTDPSQAPVFQNALDSCKGINETAATTSNAKSASVRLSVAFWMVALGVLLPVVLGNCGV